MRSTSMARRSASARCRWAIRTLVIEVTDVAQAPVASLGPRLQAHGVLPQSGNIGFAEVVARDRIRLRVYERGVGETLACGSGACAAVAVLVRRGRVDRDVDRGAARRRIAHRLARRQLADHDGRTGRIRLRRGMAAMSDLHGKSGEKLGAHEVAAWLRRHPKFLQQFPDLALSMVVPREEGPAASLASYQLEVLRDKNRELSRRLQDLYDDAQDNERLAVQTQQLTLALMRESTAAGTVRAMAATLAEDFNGDLVRIVLFAPVAGLDDVDWLQVIAAGRSRAGAVPRLPRQRRAAVRPPASGQAGAAVRHARRGRAVRRAVAARRRRPGRRRQP